MDSKAEAFLIEGRALFTKQFEELGTLHEKHNAVCDELSDIEEREIVTCLRSVLKMVQAAQEEAFHAADENFKYLQDRDREVPSDASE